MPIRPLAVSTLLLALAAGPLLPASPSFAQALVSSSSRSGSDEAARIARVERGLLSDTPVEGVPGWTLEERLRHYRMPGVSVAVVDGYRVAWAKGYGAADPERGTPVGPETMFDAGSISKAVTALAALRMVEEGKLSLDAPINGYLRSWKLPENEHTAWKPVTLRHLLSHTAGTSVSGFWGYLPDMPLPTLRQILDGEAPSISGPIRVESVPGDKWRYSGGGYVVVQQAMMDVTGRDFPALMHDYVFAPLGMTHSTFVQGLPDAMKPHAARPTSEAPWFTGEARTHPHMAAAGLYTTPADLARFLIEVQRALRGDAGTLVSRATARLMTTPVVRDFAPFDRANHWRMFHQHDQALGFMLLSRSGAPGETVYFRHDGRNAGFIASVMGDLEHGRGVVVMVNSDNNDELMREITRAVAQEYGWTGYLAEPVRPVAMSADELAAYAGRYRRTPDNVVTITAGDGYLVWRDLWTKPHRLYPVGGDRFEHVEFFGRASGFSRSADGRVAALEGWERVEGDEVFPMEHLVAGRIEEGIAALRRMSDIDEPRLATIGSNLLDTYDSPRAAEAVFRLILERHPASPPAWDALGGALKRAGDREAGLAAERRAAELREARDRQRAQEAAKSQ